MVKDNDWLTTVVRKCFADSKNTFSINEIKEIVDIFFTILHKVRYHPHSKVNSIACFTPVKNLTATSFR